jgi:dTDP-4-dehydrorhamnose 3,5-epimerase
MGIDPAVIFTPTTLPGVIIVEPVVHGDERGFFLETFREDLFAAAGIPTRFIQDNHSRSRKGILRGLHIQHPHAQGKLVRAACGRVFDVAVDVRRGSPHFGRWVGCELSDDNHRMLWIPPGFAHGFYVLSDSADFVYKCTEYYQAGSESSILWNDPAIGIEWPLDCEPVLSKKDREGMRLNDVVALPLYPGIEGTNRP